MKYLLLSLLSSLISITVIQAQNQPDRIEVNVKEACSEYFVHPIEKIGVLLFYEEAVKSVNGQRHWNFTLYDTNLTVQWEKSHFLPKNGEVVNHQHNSEELFMLINNKNAYSFGRIGLSDGSFIIKPLRLNEDFYAQGMYLHKGTIYLLGSIKRSFKLYAFTIDNLTVKSIPVSNNTNKSIHLLNEPNIIDDGKSIALPVFDDHFQERNLTIFILDNGIILENFKVKTDPRFALVDAKVYKIDVSKHIVFGTYYHRNNPNKRKIRYIASNGIYMAGFENGNQKYIKFIDFNEFNEFNSLFKVVHKNDPYVFKVSIGGKDKETNTKFHNVTTFFSDPVQLGGEIVITIECLYRQYEYVTKMEKGEKVTKKVPIGYTWTHAIIAGFDMEGNLKWEKQLPMNLTASERRPRVATFTTDNELVLVFSGAGSLYSKVISQRGEYEESAFKEKIQALYPKDKITSSFNSSVQHWYGNVFLAHGMQNIRETDKNWIAGRREVIYINKLKFE